MNNSLIKTDGIWYKIKRFFKNMFSGEKHDNKDIIQENQNINTNTEKINQNKEIVENEDEIKKSFKEEISYKEEIQEQNRKEKIATKLLDGEIDSYDLSDEEVDEMTEYFIKDIEKQNKELQRIKEHIIQMKKQLEG